MSQSSTEKKYKILQVHNYYQIPGGEDTVVANEKKLLEKHGHEVILYSRNNSELKEFSLFRKLVLPFTTIFNLKTYRDVKKIIRKEKIDIVHVHNTLNLISPAVYYAALKCKVPVVQAVHNFRLLCPGATFYRDGHICEDCVEHGLKCAIKHNCYRNSKSQTIICVINTWIHRMTRIYGKINYICLTEFNREKLVLLKQIKPDKVFVKPNFVESNDEIIPFAERIDQFIFAGRLDKLKGINTLLKAWKFMGISAPKLIICGTGPMEEWCQKYITDNQLNSVQMKGFVPNKQTRKLIAQSKALILPTQWYEGFPMTIVEAYSVGTPVIGSDIGNVGSLITMNVTGKKFKHNDVTSIKEVISKFLKENSIVQKTYEYYEINYSEQHNYQLFLYIYTTIRKEKDNE